MRKGMDYQQFIKSKRVSVIDSGFEVDDLNPKLFDFQRHAVKLALKKGRFALFEDCGLGKTFQQLEWARLVSEHTGRPVLILAPLAVTGQTIREGQRFGIDIERLSDDPVGIRITNYEQLENIDCSLFSGIVLDESSILKNFTGKIRGEIIERFKHTPYKLCCTATPSPNDHMELCNHAEFLGVMKREEMLAMYFVHDGGDTSKWRLKGHARQPFWEFVSSWAMIASNPSDLGFDGSEYVLPPLNLNEVKIETDKRENGKLFNDVAVSAVSFNDELRITLIDRVDRVKEIVNSSTENFIVWCLHNEESSRLKSEIPDAVEVRGSDDNAWKLKSLLGFADDEFRVLVTKPKIAQFGLNYQNCHNQVFASMDFSFEGLYQAIRRSYRFGQKHPVNIFLVTTDTMTNVIESIRRKEAQFEEMKNEMIKYQIHHRNAA